MPHIEEPRDFVSFICQKCHKEWRRKTLGPDDISPPRGYFNFECDECYQKFLLEYARILDKPRSTYDTRFDS